MRTPREDLEVLISADEIEERCRELGAAITRDFDGEELHVIGVLKGSFIFLSDLVRHIDLDVSIDFLGLSSYGSRRETSGVVRVDSDLSMPIEDRNVLIVEDIIDTGLTMNYLLENLETRHPRALSVCSLLDKPENRSVEVPIDYRGFEIPDKFVIGYGLDDAEFSRHIPYVGVVPTPDDNA